jgi:predicted outer membrane protein
MRTRHRGSHTGSHRLVTGDYDAPTSRRSADRPRRGLLRVWPVLALLAVSLSSAWLVTEVRTGGTASAGNLTGTPTAAKASSSPEADAPADEEEEEDAPEEDSATPKQKSRDDGAPLPKGFEQTKFGPLGPADKDFLVKVRLAGLWEGPAGRQAQKRSNSRSVKSAGRHLVIDHAKLDKQVLEIGEELGVELPDEPNADQKKWLKEMTDAEDAEAYDKVWTQRLRAAHGKVFSVVSQVRAGTRNTMVRNFAQAAVVVVMKHMTVLEQTGETKFSDLPLPPDPNQAAAPTGNTSGKAAGQAPDDTAADVETTNAASTSKKGSVGTYIIVVMLGVAGIISMVALRELYSRR